MDKATTLPRTRKEAVVTTPSSPSDSFKSRTAEKIKKMPLIRRKKKKDVSEAPTENGVGAQTDTSSIDGGAAFETSGELSSSTLTVSTASASPAVEKKENVLQKSPRLAKKQIKSLIKGGKKLFKSKSESAPIAVETSLDLHRSVPAEDEQNNDTSVNEGESTENAGDSTKDEADYGEPKEATETEEVAEMKDDWSMTATCKRVKKLSVIEIPRRDSVYSDEDDVKMENGSAVTTPETEVISEAGSSYPPTPTAETPGAGDQSSMSFERKSPSTLKKEIMAMTNRPSSENVYIIEKLRNRKVSLQARAPSDKNDLLFKILVIGELGTGKTSIIKRYVHQFFSQHYRATIGVDFALKVLSWDNNTTIRLQLWDIAGQERFGNMTRVYYKEAVGAFIVFDVTRVGTFEAVTKWKQDLDSKVQLPDGETIPCVLLANKCDQPKEGIVNNNNKMEEFCREHQFVAWYETSAKENINIDEAANCLVSKIVQNDVKRQQEKETINGTGVVAVDTEKKADAKNSNCFC